MRLALLFVVSILAASLNTTARSQAIDWQKVDETFGRKAAVSGDVRLDQLAEMGFQPLQRAFLVDVHQPAVAGYVGREDGRQSSFGTLCFHGSDFGRQDNRVRAFVRDGCQRRAGRRR